MSLDAGGWFRPLGLSREDGYDVAIRPDGSAWKHTGLLVADLADGETRRIVSGADEYIVLPLSGGDVEVEADGRRETLAGRASVFHGVADCAYLPRGRSFLLRAVGDVRVALCAARAKADVPFAVVRGSEVPIELRGAGACSRQVHNFGTPDVMPGSSIIACEVITPSGNWSSYPPHKHDEHRPGEESELEEIYYFEARAASTAPPASDPMGYCCISGTDDRPIDVRVPVRNGDVLLVPHGWHGPAMAPPGYDLYYLNVMAGPDDERVWLIRDDPAHAWVRTTWKGESVDARLPFGREEGSGR
ncbi:5-deoxy-glucuronate isomerase [Flexivirga sp. ID2601S]|uniref:5-deoxy-glucuronate isomerase n=1 Tax=Flexivirga aerilata TaxID=1656889 RepID=A0A849ALC5_9MICO|nr:5-deoxy-glucuronate isomerase [Flexivirga aerilata]NNG41149.1 5-deoxy-glucuronate isomerase [Flexivirga aerilata]